jgi:acyl homoserine lactone synthase
MIRYLYADQIGAYPQLAAEMFRHRADQFHRRQGWEVSVDAQGEERDDYDALNPLYVIWETPEGRHGGSMRFLPTVGRTMVNDHFADLTDGVHIASPLIWECTRFCLSPGGGARVSAALMQAGGEIMEGFGIAHFVGVFDARMVRIYRMIGAAPIIVGARGDGRDRISVGLWETDPVLKARVARRSGISAELSRHWFDRAFGRPDIRLARQA